MNDRRVRARRTACGTICWSGWLLLSSTTLLTAQEGIRITTEPLLVRAGPDGTYAPIGTVHEGQLYVTDQASGAYLKIWYNRNEGWVHADHVAPRSLSYDDVYRGTNVRTGPSSSYPKIGYAKTGSHWAVVATSTSGNWHQVFYEGRMAWFYAAGRATTTSYTAPEEPASVLEDVAVRATGGDITVRCGPGAGFDPIGTALSSQAYLATELFAGWRKIWFSRATGWVPASEATVTSAEYDTVDWSWLNVRTGPGLEYSIVTSVPAGSKWVPQTYAGSWHQISFDGQSCWFSGVGVTTSDFVAPDGAPPSPTTSNVGFLKLPASGPGFLRRCGANNPDHVWGTPATINGLIIAAESWGQDHPAGPRIRIGDISLPDGGLFEDGSSSHLTHRNGTDIDIFLMRSDGSDDGAADIYDPAYSSALTRDWIENYLTSALPDVQTGGILLCDPEIFGALTTVSAAAVCPGDGCPLESSGTHVAPGPNGLPYVRCNPDHDTHMHVMAAAP